jgi:CHAT domain-containing protein
MVTARGTTLRDIGATAGLSARYDAASLALSRLARTDVSARTHDAALARLRQLAAELDEALAVCWPGDDPLVLVPPPELHAAPWSLLPSLTNRPFTVASSATIWLTASRAPTPDSRRAVLVAGTDLVQAQAEVRSIARLYATSTALSPRRATAARVTTTIEHAWIAHFASHHHHRRENPLFGSMDLADGPLYLHDFLRVAQLPHVIVLSACEAARGDVGAIGDVLGAASVLMERGAATIIANAGLVADSATSSESMIELHRHLAVGVAPATALLAVRRAAAVLGPRAAALTAGFTCMGAG